MENSLHNLSIIAMREGLKRKEFSSVELTQHYLDRIKKHQNDLNCCITLCEESALQQAQAADQSIATNQAGPLTGIPIAHKDIFCTQGIKTTCASKMLADFMPPYESTVTAQCSAAGLPILAKCNMDEFAMGSSNETSFFGPCRNPWDQNRTPGGSSGGSASIVAARLAPFATGTDTGGSIRQPASFCGITGLKPTYGRVSRWGMIAFASSLDQAGILARSAEDCCDLLSIISGFDPKDSTSAQQAVPPYLTELNTPLKGKILGLPKQFFNDTLDTEQAKQLNAALSVFSELGVQTQFVDLPHLDASVPAYYVIAPAECSSNLARYDGIRFGYRCNNPTDLEDLYKRSRSEGFGLEVKRRIMIGTFTLCTGFYDAYYQKAQKIRRLIQQDFIRAFQQVDLIFAPCTPSTAFTLGEKQDPVGMYLNDIYTIAANLAGLPALSIPSGFIKHLPTGLQLIGPAFSETSLLNAGHQFQTLTDWHLQAPGLYE